MFDLSKFKKVASRSDHSILQHNDGHMIKVIHSKLQEDELKKLRGLPAHGYAEGGAVVKDEFGNVDPTVETQPPGTPSMPEQEGRTPGLFQVYRGMPEEQAQDQIPMAGAQGAIGAMEASQPAPASPYANVPGFEQMQAGIQQQQKAESNLGKAEQKAFGDAEVANQAAAKAFQENLSSKQAEIQNAIKDIGDGHINPNHYLENMGAGQKIATSIGLLLGGLGSGGDPSKNPALNFMNQQIERDIAAQKESRDKKVNLLGALERQYGDSIVAENMFRATRSETLANQIAQSAAKSKDPMAQARAKMAIGQLQAQSQGYVQQAALLDAAKAANGGGSGISPEKLVPGLVPKEHQKDVFGEIKGAENAAKSKVNIMDAFDRANSENTILKTGAGFLRTPASVSEMEALFLPLIKDQEGRVNEFELNTLRNLEPKPGDFPSKVQSKRRALENFIQGKSATPTANAYGIDLDKFNSSNQSGMSPQQQSWIQANPNSPVAQWAKKKLR